MEDKMALDFTRVQKTERPGEEFVKQTAVRH